MLSIMLIHFPPQTTTTTFKLFNFRPGRRKIVSFIFLSRQMREREVKWKYLNTNLAEMKNDYNRKCFVARLVFLKQTIACFCVAND